MKTTTLNISRTKFNKNLTLFIVSLDYHAHFFEANFRLMKTIQIAEYRRFNLYQFVNFQKKEKNFLIEIIRNINLKSYLLRIF